MNNMLAKSNQKATPNNLGLVVIPKNAPDGLRDLGAMVLRSCRDNYGTIPKRTTPGPCFVFKVYGAE